MVKDMCAEAGLAPKTNHSLRATGATCLFQSHVPERIIQKTTGHQSLESLRTYERVSTEQHQAVSRIMMSTVPTSVQEQVPTSQGELGKTAGKVFGDITNCTIGKLTININPTMYVKNTTEKELDELASTLDLDVH